MRRLCLVFLIMTMQLNAQLKNVDFKQLDSLQNDVQKPVLIFLHSDWCKYCVAMKQTTFKNQKLIQLLNDNFYVLFFDPENTTKVLYQDKYYQWIPQGIGVGYHEFTNLLKQELKEIVLPSIYISYCNKFQLLNQGYIKAEELVVLLNSLMK